MTYAAISQTLIVVFGCAGVVLVGSVNPRIRRWGYVSALCGEPLWLYSSITAGQWGVVAMCAVYTAGWLRGIWGHFGEADNGKHAQ